MEQRYTQHFAEENTERRSLALENQQACDPALAVNGKGEATISGVRQSLSLSLSLLQSTETGLNVPGIFERTRWSLIRRVEACVESHGGHFERLL
jgi:hypothetical protein